MMFRFISSFLFFSIACILYLSRVPGVFELGLMAPVAAYLIWGLSTDTARHAWGGVVAGWAIDAFSPHFFGAHALLFLSIAGLLFGLKHYFLRRYFWGEMIMISLGLVFSEIAFAVFLGLDSYATIASRLTWSYAGSAFIPIILTAAAVYLFLSLWFKKEQIESESYQII